MTEENKDTKPAEPVLLFPEEINIKAGYRGSLVYFYLRMISLAEENQFMQRFVKLPEDPAERADAEYRILLDGLKAWSTRPPEVKGPDGKPAPLVPGKTAAEALEGFFAQRTVATERLLNTAVMRYRDEMSPDVSFF